MEGCEKHHPQCRVTQTQLPTRLIDLLPASPCLVEVADHQEVLQAYVTLSHCWGHSTLGEPTKTTRENVQARKKGIPLISLSPLFRDVVHLVRTVGFRYLWIDSLCIIQNDAADWGKESQAMAKVYANASFNIASTFLPDSNCSLFEQRLLWVEGAEGIGYCEASVMHRLEGHDDGPVYVKRSHIDTHAYALFKMHVGRKKQSSLT